MREPIGAMSDRYTTRAEREKFMSGIGYAIIGMGGSQTGDDETYCRGFQLDTAAGIMTCNVTYETNDSWLGSVFCHFRYRAIAEEIVGKISATGWKNFTYNADWTAEQAIQDWVSKITPVTTTVPA